MCIIAPSADDPSPCPLPDILFPRWPSGLTKCICLHLSIEYGGCLFNPQCGCDKLEIYAGLEKSWIESWSLPNLCSVYFHHTHNNKILGDIPPGGDEVWIGETRLWQHSLYTITAMHVTHNVIGYVRYFH